MEVWPGQFALVGEKSPGPFPNLPPKPHFFTVGTVSPAQIFEGSHLKPRQSPYE